MMYLVLCSILHLLFLISNVYSNVSIQPKYEDESTKSVSFVYRHGLKLECNITSDEPIQQVKWEKDGEKIEDIKLLKGRVKISSENTTYILQVQQAKEDDSGEYSCVVFQGENRISQGNITVAAKILVKVPANANFVEGEKLRLHCSVIGKPPPIISWHYRNDTYNATYTESTDRIILEEDPEKKVPNAILKINVVEMYDRGKYTCIGKSDLIKEEVQSECMVRIKDKYAAVWPFLGICAEVFVLCVIIIIYEKKRNKTELEESDTDQSPDQKNNTPDHGKESNLRHRQ